MHEGWWQLKKKQLKLISLVFFSGVSGKEIANILSWKIIWANLMLNCFYLRECISLKKREKMVSSKRPQRSLPVNKMRFKSLEMRILDAWSGIVLVLLLDLYSFIRTHGANRQQQQRRGKNANHLFHWEFLLKKFNSFKSVDALCQWYYNRCVRVFSRHAYSSLDCVDRIHFGLHCTQLRCFFNFFFQSKFKFTDISHIGLMFSF